MNIKAIFNNKELTSKVEDFIKEIEGDKLMDYKMLALKFLMTEKRPYDDFSYNAHNLLSNLYIKKIDYLSKATTKADIKKILGVSQIINYGSEIREGEFYVIEEELLMWSITSFREPLNSIGHERYMTVFRKYFGEEAYNSVIR